MGGFSPRGPTNSASFDSSGGSAPLTRPINFWRFAGTRVSSVIAALRSATTPSRLTRSVSFCPWNVVLNSRASGAAAGAAARISAMVLSLAGLKI